MESGSCIFFSLLYVFFNYQEKKIENSVWNINTIYEFLRIVHLLIFDFNSFSSSSYSFYLKIFASATLFQTYFQFLLVYSLFSPAAHQQHSVCHLPYRCLKGSRFHRQHLCYLETKKNIHQKFLLNWWIVLWYGWPTKDVKLYFHPGPLSEILTIANFRSGACSVWIST